MSPRGPNLGSASSDAPLGNCSGSSVTGLLPGGCDPKVVPRIQLQADHNAYDPGRPREPHRSRRHVLKGGPGVGAPKRQSPGVSVERNGQVVALSAPAEHSLRRWRWHSNPSAASSGCAPSATRRSSFSRPTQGPTATPDPGLSLRNAPGIEYRYTQTVEVRDVPRNDGEVVMKRSRHDQAVGNFDLLPLNTPLTRENAPSFRNRSGNRKDTVAKPGPQSPIEPVL